MYNITEENLDKLGIYDLRSLARKVGVNSPTSKKKEKLIEEIKSIQSGSQKPVFNNKFGRPVKSLNSSGDLFSDFVISGDQEIKDLIEKPKGDDRFIIFNQDFDSSNMFLSQVNAEVQGILRKTIQGNFYLLNELKLGTKVYVVIDSNLAKKYNMIEGDLVCGTAQIFESKNYAQMIEVLKINGVYAYENKVEDSQDYVIPDKPLIGTNIFQGQSKLCEVEGGQNSALDYVNRHLKQFVAEGYECVVLGLQIPIETKLKLDKMTGIKDVVSFIDDTAKFSEERINDAINYTASLFLHQKRVVLFILDIFGIYDILDTLYQTNPNIHSQESGLYIRKLLGQSRATQNSSISCIGLYSTEQKQMYLKEILELQKIIAN